MLNSLPLKFNSRQELQSKYRNNDEKCIIFFAKGLIYLELALIYRKSFLFIL